MIHDNFGENLEVHFYNIDKIKKAIADRALGGWGQQRADFLQREEMKMRANTI